MSVLDMLLNKKVVINILVLVVLSGVMLALSPSAHAQIGIGQVGGTCDPTNTKNVGDFPACTSIDTGELGFQIPSLGDILTFVIRAFFVIAGLAALFYMLLGAFAWVTSGGDADAVSAAQQKIQAAVVGMLIIVGVLAIIWTLEQVIFNRRICLGLSCPLTLPGLIEGNNDGTFCCACTTPTGGLGAVADMNTFSCNEDGSAAPR